MRKKFLRVTVLSALVVGASASGFLVETGHAQDAATEARLLAVDGKFAEVEEVLKNAPAEVQKDAALHSAVADLAMKASRSKQGEEKRENLVFARNHFVIAIDLKADDATAAVGVLQAAQELADLDLMAKNPDGAAANVKVGIDAAEKALAAGVTTAQFKINLGQMYASRSRAIKSMNDVAKLFDYAKRAALLLSEASAGNEQAGKLLSEASSIMLRVANMIHESIPKEDEKRDDEALTSAIDMATRACEQPGASDSDYSAHLAALRLASSWGMKLEQKPFMQPLAPPIPGLAIQIARAAGWKVDKTAEWDLYILRDVKDMNNPGSVQIMLKKWEASQSALGKAWSALADQTARQFEKEKEKLADLGSIVEPKQLVNPRNPVEMWHFAVSGRTEQKRAVRVSEFNWFEGRKKNFVYQLKILDWRPIANLSDPDLHAFITSAIGDGFWQPPGAPAAAAGTKKKQP
jgi:hypothetical protein